MVTHPFVRVAGIAGCVLLLASCKAEGKNIHKAKLDARPVKDPAITISVPKDFAEDKFGQATVLKSPTGNPDARLEVQVWSTTDMPTSKAGARSTISGYSGREITFATGADFVGIAWAADTETATKAMFWKKLPNGTVIACMPRITYLMAFEEKTQDEHGMFLRRICESIQPGGGGK